MIARIFATIILALILSSCASKPKESLTQLPAKVQDPYLEKLAALPPKRKPISVAVYSFTDQTGQRRASEVYADLSHAVSQGGNDLLIGMLLRTGRGQWFDVYERDELSAVVQERNLKKLAKHRSGPRLAGANYLLTGGIVGYDSNHLTGGIGARYLGIGGDAEYRSDLITASMRLIDVRTGKVLVAVESHDTVMSYGIKGGAVRYFSGRLFEAEAGFTRNEVTTLSMRRAIAKALLALIGQAVEEEIWKTPDHQAEMILNYINRDISEFDPAL